jgi:hypothetical protein
MPWYLGNSYGSASILRGFWGLGFAFPFLMVWSLVWGGLALWHAAKRDEKFWFIVFLLVHTLGILEIIYLMFVVKLFRENETVKPGKTKAKKRSK